MEGQAITETDDRAMTIHEPGEQWHVKHEIKVPRTVSPPNETALCVPLKKVHNLCVSNGLCDC